MKEMIDSAMGRECVVQIDNQGVTHIQFLKQHYHNEDYTWAEAFVAACRRARDEKRNA